MKKKIILIDILALLGFALTFYPSLTGYSLHEWVGLGVGSVLLVHLLQHWRWVCSISKKMACLQRKIRMRFIVDVMMATGFVSIIATGLIISALLNLSLAHYETWRDLHFASSYATLAMLALKTALHWSWLKGTIRNAFKPAKGAETLSAQQLSRRTFLKQAGLAGLGLAALAGGLGALLSSSKPVAAGSQANTVPSTPLSPTQVPTQAPTNLPNQGIGTAPTAMPTQALPTATETAVMPVVTGVTLCRYSCAYPGKCRKYVDNNGNGLCDRGEPIW